MVCKPTKVTHSPYSIQHTGHITYVAWYVDLTLSGTILKNVFLSYLILNVNLVKVTLYVWILSETKKKHYQFIDDLLVN